MMIPRLKDIRTRDGRGRLSGGAVEGVAPEIIILEIRENFVDLGDASPIRYTEPVLVLVSGALGPEVSFGPGDIPPGSINGEEDVPLFAPATTEFELMHRMSDSEITGELDAGKILNIWM